jgi:hypothetical protein
MGGKFTHAADHFVNLTTLPTSNRWNRLSDIVANFEDYRASLRPSQYNLSVILMDFNLTSTKLRGLQNEASEVIRNIATTLTQAQKQALLARLNLVFEDYHQFIVDTNLRLGQITEAAVKEIDRVGPIIAAEIPVVGRAFLEEYKSTMNVIKISIALSAGTYVTFKVLRWFWKK